MSVIAVGGLPTKANLKKIVKILAPLILGHFEALNFGPSKKDGKVCYIRLSERLDPLQIVERINGKTSKFKAFIPDHVPDLPLAIKPKKIPRKLQRYLKIAPNYTLKQVLLETHGQIMKEMQFKYTGLFALSKKTKNHQLIKTIGKIVYSRLNLILQTDHKIDTCFFLSKAYRRKHPHFGDFQLILTTLHAIQDALGQPRQQMQESDLTTLNLQRYVVDKQPPSEKLKAVHNKYSNLISTKIMEYVKELKTTTHPDNDSMEEAARLKVREQLKKMYPYIPTIVRQVVAQNFLPEKTKFHLVHIYGEPALPGKEVTGPWLKRRRGLGAAREQRMFNLLGVRAPRDALRALLAADGALLGGSKLVIRPSDILTYQISPEVLEEEEYFHDTNQDVAEQDDGMEWSEAW